MALRAALLGQKGPSLLQNHVYFLRRGLQTLAAEETKDSEEPSALLSVPPELVELIARRSLGMISVSPYITDGIEDLLKASARNSKAIRKSGFALTERLKQNSRSQHRGGVNELTTMGGTNRLKSRDRKVPKWSDTAQNIRIQGLMDFTDEAAEQLEEDYDLPRDEEPVQKRVKYTASETVGYAASRLPACYAVVWRVLDELDMRVTDFRPESMLDFGAGPGTAIWAASEVWEDSLTTVHAVEPSEAMRWMGQQIEQRCREPRTDDDDFEGQPTAQHGFYEADHPEPGEPTHSGEDLIPALAASNIEVPLPLTGNRPQDTALQETPSPQGQLQGTSIVIGDQLSSATHGFGKSWGIRWLQHLQGFGDRKQIAAARGGRKRPSWVQSTGGRKYDLVIASYAFGELQSPGEQRQALKAMWQATADMLVIVEPGTPAGSGLVRAARAQILEWETAADGQKQAHVVAPCPHDGRCPMDGLPTWCHFTQRFERSRVQRLAKIRHGKPLPRSFQDERFSYVAIRKGQRPPSGAGILTTEQTDMLEDGRLVRPQQQGRNDLRKEWTSGRVKNREVLGLIQESLDGGEDSEDELDWELPASDLQDESSWTEDQSETEAEGMEEEDEPQELTSGMGDIGASPENERAQFQENNQALKQAIKGSQSWSRIIRRPRKRHGHVIVDICTAAGPKDSPGASGLLVQQAVSKSERKKFLGSSGYRLAKRLTWGDLWPSSFQRFAHKIKQSEDDMRPSP